MVGLLVMGLLVGGAFAQGPGKKVNFSVNVGMQTNLWKGSSFNLSMGTLDVRAGIRLGRSFEISPELMYVTGHKFNFDYGYLYPGIVFNFVTHGFFVGAGAVLPIAYGGGSFSSGNPAPKINIGYTTGHFMLTAYMITWTEQGISFFDMNFIGATVGYRF